MRFHTRHTEIWQIEYYSNPQFNFIQYYPQEIDNLRTLGQAERELQTFLSMP